MSPLRQRMIEDMTVRNLSPSTQQSYIYAIAKFSRHFGCAPDRLSFEQVRAYQLHLISQKRSWSHINQVACALRFFYGVTLGQTEAFERIIGGQKPDKLPLVLSAEEIVRFLDAVRGLRNRVGLATAYAAGLRVSEVVRLKVSSMHLISGWHGCSPISGGVGMRMTGWYIVGMRWRRKAFAKRSRLGWRSADWNCILRRRGSSTARMIDAEVKARRSCLTFSVIASGHDRSWGRIRRRCSVGSPQRSANQR
jgi:integrase